MKPRGTPLLRLRATGHVRQGCFRGHSLTPRTSGGHVMAAGVGAYRHHRPPLGAGRGLQAGCTGRPIHYPCRGSSDPVPFLLEEKEVWYPKNPHDRRREPTTLTPAFVASLRRGAPRVVRASPSRGRSKPTGISRRGPQPTTGADAPQLSCLGASVRGASPKGGRELGEKPRTAESGSGLGLRVTLSAPMDAWRAPCTVPFRRRRGAFVKISLRLYVASR